jgi:prepilin-type N-terminal cleavage/methylation domain-containing protein
MPGPGRVASYGRHGFTLLEMLVVIAVSTAIVGLAVALVVTMMHIEKEARSRLGTGVTQGRLADQFRRDVRASTGLSFAEASSDEGQKPACELTLGSDRVVRYETSGPAVVRTELDADQVVRRETYRLPRGATISVELAEDPSPAIASLRITPGDNTKNRPPVQSARIAAVLGADNRFVSSETSEEQEP